MKRFLAAIFLMMASLGYGQTWTYSTGTGLGCPGTQTCTTSSITVPAPPNVVVVTVPSFKTTKSGTWAPTMTVADSGARTYTATPTAAFNSTTYNGIFMFYFINVPAGSITLTANSDASTTVEVMEAVVAQASTGTIFFDKDAVNQTTTTTATPILLPSINVTTNNEFLYNSIIPVTGGIGPNTPWVNANNQNGCCAIADGYYLNAPSGTTTANMSDGQSTDMWVSVIGAWGISSGNNGTKPKGSFF